MVNQLQPQPCWLLKLDHNHALVRAILAIPPRPLVRGTQSAEEVPHGFIVRMVHEIIKKLNWMVRDSKDLSQCGLVHNDLLVPKVNCVMISLTSRGEHISIKLQYKVKIGWSRVLEHRRPSHLMNRLVDGGEVLLQEALIPCSLIYVPRQFKLLVPISSPIFDIFSSYGLTGSCFTAPFVQGTYIKLNYSTISTQFNN